MDKFFILFLMLLFPIAAFSENIRLSVGEQRTLHFPGLKKMENRNKKLMRIQVHPEKDTLTLLALSKGNGEFLIRDDLGERLLGVIVYSKLSLDLEREIKELTRDIEGIEVRSIGHQVIISGHLLTREDNKTLQKIEKRYEKVLNMAVPLRSAQVMEMEKMIQIELKMMELNSNRLRAIGVQFPDSIKTRFSLNHQVESGDVTTTLQASTQFDLIFRALEKKGLAKILANPKLICKNGAEAKFLAGGEIPIRLSHERSLSVEWKPYGILLHISPITDSENNISVSLRVEISMLNPAQSVDGIPALLTRRLETSLNVKDGEAIVLSGLIHKENSQDVHKVPALSAIPILGALFTSKEFQTRNSELLIFVTPTIRKSQTEDSL